LRKLINYYKSLHQSPILNFYSEIGAVFFFAIFRKLLRKFFDSKFFKNIFALFRNIFRKFSKNIIFEYFRKILRNFLLFLYIENFFENFHLFKFADVVQLALIFKPNKFLLATYQNLVNYY